MRRYATRILLLALLASTAGHAATVRIHYDVGFGNRVAVRGDAPELNWEQGVDAMWTEGNIWEWQSAPGSGSFHFKPLINDRDWSTGANYFVPTDDSVVDIYPFFGPSRGTLVTLSDFYSPQLDNRRDITIYLPPSYFENTAKRYPVLYMHDGQNLFFAELAFAGVEWEVDEWMDRLIGSGPEPDAAIREAIVVGLDNTVDRTAEYTPTEDPFFGGGDAERYLDFLQFTVMPLVNVNLRTLTGPGNTLIMGSSLGGLVSCYALWRRSQVFGSGGCLSSSFWWDDEIFSSAIERYQGAKKPAVFYSDIGALEGGVDEAVRFRDALEQQGYVAGLDLFHYVDPFGQHNELAWSTRLHIPLGILLPFQ